MEDEKLADKTAQDDKTKVTEAGDAAIQWLDANQLAGKDELEAKLKELEEVCRPIMQKAYQSAGSVGFPDEGPMIEEVEL